MTEAPWLALNRALDAIAAEGRVVEFWLRDDDAVEPTTALDQLLTATAKHSVPFALAVIPALTGPALTERLASSPHVTVVQHGWRHTNHAPDSEKKQEFGRHRPVDAMLAEIALGRSRLESLYSEKFCSLFVPPWNRIADELAGSLPEAGLTALSTFGPQRMGKPFAINSTLDVMDWKERRGRTPADLIQLLLLQMSDGAQPIGVLTHHLVHDQRAWNFLDMLFEITMRHPVCRWLSIREILDRRRS